MPGPERQPIRMSVAKVMASEIMEVLPGGTPQEFEYALTFAIACYLKANHGSTLQAAYDLFCSNLCAMLEELDAKPVLDLSSINFNDLMKQ